MKEKLYKRGKVHFTLKSAACVCAALALSGITVIGAASSYADRIADAMHFYGKERDGEVTPVQNELYAAYGSGINVEWETGAGTVVLNAVLYDEGCLCIPFTLYPDAELTPGEDMMQSDLSNEKLFELLRQIGVDTQGEDYRFRIKGREDVTFSGFTQLDPTVQEDGSLLGSYLLKYTLCGEEQGFVQGDVIQCTKAVSLPDGEPWGRVLEEGEDTEGLVILEEEINGEIVKIVDLRPEAEVLAEIVLENAPMPKREIPAADIQLPYGLTADTVTITPIALYMQGTWDVSQMTEDVSQMEGRIPGQIAVVLKDGTVIGRALNGGGGMAVSDKYEYAISILFEGAIDLDEVAGVRIADEGEEILWVPVQ